MVDRYRARCQPKRSVTPKESHPDSRVQMFQIQKGQEVNGFEVRIKGGRPTNPRPDSKICPQQLRDSVVRSR
jgi:hypothetical protein